ncbi:putative nucleotidyltransferase [Caldicellulosiruptor bescii]|uniref:DNA polymerase beta domain protein region n=2 Tax=Caldicellulosiruptor bescii TaxID=31899 RepID=B9MQ86_CALBD|nr:nucleotidyltransferase domain-containing protein [Caldicellulosiruptor bescii]ACM59878.1 DNA polymerase beta domain protein region [Caldicellulosiruptor bescii DSM 6725]PBC87288.1 putative nucleotidyltransferase [Caldicellulosiruptor bescii]PBC90228.1 putative nucleotidyltransferase [Caldicellulosiruptor bescii]PBD04344.1 putative nucleotidyltransferase [Caldicellulosiruptor bescii]PBD06025.1 putative nucleotidyltransferase [Caldicellulosiruptor bescii]
MKVETKRFGIEEEILDKIIEIFKKYKQVKKACIFGSRARGDYRRGSDIDICIWLEEESENPIYKIQNELEEVNTILLFDVVAFNSITKESLKESIIKEGVIIYERENSREV